MKQELTREQIEELKKKRFAITADEYQCLCGHRASPQDDDDQRRSGDYQGRSPEQVEKSMRAAAFCFVAMLVMGVVAAVYAFVNV